MLNKKTQRSILFGLICAGALGSLATFYGFSIIYGTGDKSTYTNTGNKGYNTNDTKEQESAIGNWVTRDAGGFFTMWLVIIGFGQAGLFIWQLNLMREGVADAKKAADTASEAAKTANASVEIARAEFNATHRPHLIVRDVCLDGNNIAYLLINKGDAKATIVESWIMDEYIPKNGGLRPLRSYGHDCLKRLNFAVGEMKDLTYCPKQALNFFSSMELYFVGTIVYSDGAGQRRRTVFRRRWDVERQGFVSLGDPDQEYSD
jgi:hypothetical protein